MKKFNQLCEDVIKSINPENNSEINPEKTSEVNPENTADIYLNKIKEKLTSKGFNVKNIESDLGLELRFSLPDDYKEFYMGTLLYPKKENNHDEMKRSETITETKFISIKYYPEQLGKYLICEVIYYGNDNPASIVLNEHFLTHKAIAARFVTNSARNSLKYKKRIDFCNKDITIDKILDQAITAYNSIVLKDWSEYEIDKSIPPIDNTKLIDIHPYGSTYPSISEQLTRRVVTLKELLNIAKTKNIKLY